MLNSPGPVDGEESASGELHNAIAEEHTMTLVRLRTAPQTAALQISMYGHRITLLYACR